MKIGRKGNCRFVQGVVVRCFANNLFEIRCLLLLMPHQKLSIKGSREDLFCDYSTQTIPITNMNRRFPRQGTDGLGSPPDTY